LDLRPEFPLEKLLRELEKGETPDRIRLSSVEPGDFSPGLISTLSQSNKICPHLHIAIQSGDDEILKKMKRDYDRLFLFHLIQELHLRIPDLSLGADVIVGFPGETEEKFRNTYGMIESLPFSYLHVFPFSRRKGTPAFQFPRRVSEKEVKKRAEMMRELGRQKRQVFYRQFLSQKLSVLIADLKHTATGRWKGLSRNYIPVFLTNDNGIRKHEDWVNREWTVIPTGLDEKGLIGKVAER
jgi:threonylcarbamoyladenosine tRNA methylthiotransferase MtaB